MNFLYERLNLLLADNFESAAAVVMDEARNEDPDLSPACLLAILQDSFPVVSHLINPATRKRNLGDLMRTSHLFNQGNIGGSYLLAEQAVETLNHAETLRHYNGAAFLLNMLTAAYEEQAPAAP